MAKEYIHACNMYGESHIVKRASTKLFRISNHIIEFVIIQLLNVEYKKLLFLIIYYFIKKYDLECSTFANGDL